jgi:tetratricopeptide (TPR) repeat protein
VVVLLVVALLLCPSLAVGQQSEGVVDLRADAEEQIARIETLLRGNADIAAERQAIMLRWLVDLYGLVGDHDSIEWCFQRILAFFPYDVGAMNAYAQFLLDTRKDGARAESLLVSASQWGRFTDARSLDRGRTYELLARTEIGKGGYEEAVRFADLAIELMDDESSAGARRLLAESYCGMGAYDKAAGAYIDLIALERGANREDINALKLIVGQTEKYSAADLNGMIDTAISKRTDERRRQIEAEGAELVSFTSSDGVVLEGTLRRRNGKGALLFVPNIGETRSIYKPYAQLLGIDGVSSLSLDLRGQGGSRSDSLLTQKNLPIRHFERLPDDIVAGFRFLQNELELDPGRIAIVTEGRACGLVEKAVHRGQLQVPIVYLSPIFEREDRELINAIAFHPAQPILLFYSSEDIHAMKSTMFYKDTNDFERLDIRVLDRAGHGVDVLRRDPAALEAFQAWARSAVGRPETER